MNYSASQIKSGLLYGASFLNSLADKVGSGLVNISGALNYLKNNITTSPSPTVVSPQPVSTAPVVSSSISYNIENLSSKRISGWVKDSSNLNKRMTVEVYVNDKDFYSRKANMMRNDIGGRFGFNIKFDSSKFVKGSNKITVRFIDPIDSKVIVVERILVI